MAKLLLPPDELKARIQKMNREQIKAVYTDALAVSHGSSHAFMPDTAKLIVQQIENLYPSVVL